MNQVDQLSPYKSSYRPEIDGLRAFAVLSVVAFHAFPSWLNGGFVGVDVFFVISGFLITSHIFENLDKGQFSFTDFFSRRIRRLFPALILVMAFALAFGWIALLADQFVQLGKHVASSAAFIINFILVDESGYFDNAAQTKPMLHLWSLAVEEQFYIVWPFVLWLAWRRKINLLTITILMALLSFYLNLRFVNSYPIETFFWPMGRFWELYSGSILAWFFLYKSDFLNQLKLWVDKVLVRVVFYKKIEADGSTTSNLMSFVGLLLLAYSVIRINESLSFPSKWALVPVLGAVLVIASGSKAWLNRILLMNPIAVWFGLISYPLYLWHWPIISFSKILEIDANYQWVAVLLSIIFAWLTYIFVERPMRFGTNSIRNTFALMLGIIIVGIFGFLLFHKGDFRLQKNYEYFDRIYHGFNSQFHECENKKINEQALTWLGYKRCWQSKTGTPNVLLIGDSHAEHLFYGFARSLPDFNVASYYKAGRPSLNDKAYSIIFDQILSYKAQKSDIKILLTTMYSQDYQTLKIVDDLSPTIKMLQDSGYEVALVGDVPEFKYAPPHCRNLYKNRILLRDLKTSCVISIEENQRQQSFYDEQLKILANKFDIPYVNASDVLCEGGGTCSMFDRGGRLLYADRHHLNTLGSKLIADELVSQLIDAGFLRSSR